ncbi:MAG: hypothetical protein ACKV2V_01245, partial [Blastocatellia bacterium]
MTYEQMQESIATLTDDMTEVKDYLKTVREEHRLFTEKFAILFQAMELNSQHIEAMIRFQQRTDERHARAMA